MTLLADGPSRTLLSTAARFGVPIRLMYRHLPVLRHCLSPRDQILLLARCARSECPTGRGGFGNVLLLTHQRLVVTSQNGLLRRLRLHLNADLNQLAEVAWTPEPEQGGVQLAATAVDGVREHFWIRLDASERVWGLDAMLRDAFTMAALPPAPAPAVPAAEPAVPVAVELAAPAAPTVPTVVVAPTVAATVVAA